MQVTKWWSGTVARCKARVTRRCTTSSPSPSKSLRWSWLWRGYYQTDEAEFAIPPRPPPLKKVIDYFSISFFIHFSFHLFANNFHSFDINTTLKIYIQSFVNSLTNAGYVVWNLHSKVIFSLDSLFIIPLSTLEHTSQPLLLCYHYILGYLQSTKRITIWNR